MASMELLLMLSVTVVQLARWTDAYSVLLATMGGTKSHTMPFIGLGTALIQKGHNVTLASGFPGPAANNGLRELVLPGLQVCSENVFFLFYGFVMGMHSTMHTIAVEVHICVSPDKLEKFIFRVFEIFRF